MAEHGRKPRKDAADAGVGEAFVAQSYLKCFKSVRRRAGVEPADRFQLIESQGSVHCAVRGSTNLGSTFWPGFTWAWLPIITRSFSCNPAVTSTFVGVSMPSVTGRSSISSFRLIRYTVGLLPPEIASTGTANAFGRRSTLSLTETYIPGTSLRSGFGTSASVSIVRVSVSTLRANREMEPRSI